MLLDIRNMKAGYGGYEALRGVSISVSEGEMVALIGPNGAGKSTVLKAVFGIAEKTSGQVMWKGSDISSLPTYALLERGIGFVPQGRLVFPSLTVAENLDMGAYLIDHKETKEGNLRNVLDQFPVLERKYRTRAGMLSGGEQQMLAIGRALMMTPDLLMLDEPSLGLAPKIVDEVFERLEEIRTRGTSLLVVEQNVRMVLSHASRGYLLAGGEVKHEGTAGELSDEKLMREAYLMS